MTVTNDETARSGTQYTRTAYIRSQLRRPVASLWPCPGVGEGNVAGAGAGMGEGAAPVGPMSNNRRMYPEVVCTRSNSEGRGVKENDRV